MLKNRKGQMQSNNNSPVRLPESKEMGWFYLFGSFPLTGLSRAFLNFELWKKKKNGLKNYHYT